MIPKEGSLYSAMDETKVVNDDEDYDDDGDDMETNN